MAMVIKAISQICDALSLKEMWMYVCNSMECKSNCCDNFIICSCVTSEIDIEEDNNNSDACAELCMSMFNSASTFSTESIRDIEEE